MEDHTVAIDWSGISNEPIGADIGVLLGSGLTWGSKEELMVVENIENLYARYLDGLIDSEWIGSRTDIRSGFYTQFGIYILLLVTYPGRLESGEFESHRARDELRFGVSREEKLNELGEIAPLLIRYLEEFKSLAD